MLKRPHYVALIIVTLIALVVLNLPGGAVARLRFAFNGFFLPLFGFAATSQNLAGQAGDLLVPRRELIRENQQLRRDNQQLQLVATQAVEIARENARLRQFLGWREQAPWKGRLKLGQVILREPANWWRTVQIDLGSRDGLRTNLPVLTVEGLVGRVSAVSFDRAQVVLLGDPNCRVAALVENATRDNGVLGPSGPVPGDVAVLSYLPPGAVVKPGQKVVTSGLGGIFPRAFPSGRCWIRSRWNSGCRRGARQTGRQSQRSLEEIWVLMP